MVRLSELEKYFEHQGMGDELTWVVSAPRQDSEESGCKYGPIDRSIFDEEE